MVHPVDFHKGIRMHAKYLVDGQDFMNARTFALQMVISLGISEKKWLHWGSGKSRHLVESSVWGITGIALFMPERGSVD